MTFEEHPPFYRAVLPNGRLLEGDARTALDHMSRYVVTGVLDEDPHGVLLHGASIVAREGRILMLGRKASGKTTLALRLLAEGLAVECDEHISLREHDVIARPRRLRVKRGSLPFVPSLAERIVESPFVEDYDGNVVYSVDPSVGGSPWRIRPAPAAHFVFIEPNHGGRSVLAPIPQERAFELLLANAIMLGEDRLQFAVRLRRHVAGAKAWRLSLGDHDRAVARLQQIAT